jgi:hypothetical protein
MWVVAHRKKCMLLFLIPAPSLSILILYIMALICQYRDISFKYATDLKRVFVPTYFTYLSNILLPTYSRLVCF